MLPELYSALAQEKVIREAVLRSGVSQGVMQACWDAAGSVIMAWDPDSGTDDGTQQGGSSSQGSGTGSDTGGSSDPTADGDGN